MLRLLLSFLIIFGATVANGQNSPCYWSGQLVKCFPTTGLFLDHQRSLRLGDATTNYVELKAPASVTTYSLTYPLAQGAAGQVLSNDGSGNYSWVTAQLGPLTGDVTSSGTVTTVAKIQGTTVSGTTGSGNVVFSASPVLTTPNLDTPSVLTLTNATGLPLTTGVVGVLLTANGGTGQNSTATFPTSGVVVTEAAAETLTNKSISGSTNTLTNIPLTTAVTGVLPIANGGTNSSTALNNNRVIESLSGAIVEAPAITASRALVSDTNGLPVASATTSTEIGFVSGVTSPIQTQLNGKQATGNYITSLTGDVTATGPGAAAATIAKIQGTTVTGTTGTGNVVFDTSPTISNPIVGTQAQSDASTKAASTAYVTTAIANAVAGVNPAVAVQAATTSSSDTSGFTYNNGVSGIGATLTSTSNNTPLTVDGFTFTALGQRLLVKDNSTSANNGIYYVTQLQAALLPLILTRSLDFDQPSDINNTGAIPVINGTVNGTTQWVVTSQVTTIGTDPITFTKFTRNPADYLLKANNLSDVNSASTSFGNISPLTTKGDLLGFSTANARVPVGTNGQILSADSTQILGVKWVPAGGTGTVTSVDVSGGTTGLTTSGGPVTTSGTITLAGTLAVANGGTSVTSVTTTPTATAFAGWDANKNLSANMFIPALATITDQASNTLTSTAAETQSMTPTVARTVKLDNSFTAGQKLYITNNAAASTTAAIITLTANDNSTIATIYQGMTYQVLCNTASPADSTKWTGLSTIESQWIAYTPTYGASFGTVTQSNAFYKRIGDSLLIQANFKVGAVTTGAATVTIPSGLSIDTAKIKSSTTNDDSSVVGSAISNSSQVVTCLVNNNTATNVIGFGYNASDVQVQFQSANNYANNNLYFGFKAEIPISGWKQSKG